MMYSRSSLIFLVLVACSITQMFCNPSDCGCRSGKRIFAHRVGGEQECDQSDDEDGEAREYCDDCRPIDTSKEECAEKIFDMCGDGVEAECPSISDTQRQNKRLINRAILWGINPVCNIELDNPVLAACGDGEVDKILITVSGIAENKTKFPLKDMNRLELYKDSLTSKNVTYVIITGWPASNHCNPVDEFISIGECRPDAAAIIVDVGRNLEMVYNTLNNNSEMIAYLIYRLIKYLFCIGLKKRNTVFVGASIGAQILAMCITLYNNDSLHSNDKLEKFYGLDPTTLCNGANFITPDIANQVVIIHGDSERYGIKKNLGTIDVYPNGGIGYQPGCDSCQCSHVRPMELFVEAVCNFNSLIVVKCRSWKDFTRGRCINGEKCDLLHMPVFSRGVYFVRTGKQRSYGLSWNGAIPHREFCFD